MKRDELKSLIKECLIEILSEGLSPAAKPNVNQSVKRNFVSSPQRNNAVVSQQRNIETKQQKLNNLTSKPNHNNIMSAIFEDTMRNTLPKMNKAEANHFKQDYNAVDILHDTPSQYMQQHDKFKNQNMTAEELVETSMPEDLFGEETSEKWSKIAFNDLNK